MSELTSTSPQEETAAPKVCLNCGNPEIIKDAPNPLCNECREKFIKFPIPLWVKIFGGVIAALVIFSFFSFPQNLSRGITFKKGLKAENNKNYITAQRYFREVVNNTPQYLEAKAHLLIAAFYNNDMQTFGEMYDTLSGKTIDNKSLFDRVQLLMNKAAEYYPNDSFITMNEKYKAISDTIPEIAYIELLSNNKDDIFSLTMYASFLYNHNNYAKADSITSVVLRLDGENINALGMKAALKRLQNDAIEAISFSDKLISINHESVYGLSSKARSLLKLNKNKEALNIATESHKLDSTDLYAKATLALAYHFNNKIEERDKIIKVSAKPNDTLSMNYFQFVLDVIDNKDHL